jgi:hypothetical protein
MKEKVKNFVVGVIMLIILMVIMGGCLYHATSAESWYAGMHDSKCETAGYGECGCYDRFMEREANK